MEEVIVQFKEWKGKLVKDTTIGGSPRLRLIDPENGEPIATATVAIAGRYPPEGHVFIKDWSENEGMLATLQSAGIVHDTGIRVKTGYCEAALCRLLK